MKNNFTKSLVVLGLLLVASCAFSQTILTNTTLSTALHRGIKGVNLTLGSITGIVAGTDLYVDSELMQVVSVPATGTTIYVIRGYGGTAEMFHSSGATVWIIPAAAAPYALITQDFGQDPAGTCARGGASLSGGLPTANSTLYLPIFDTRTATVFDCIGNQFVAGNIGNGAGGILPQFQIPFPNPGATAYTSINTTGTTLAATTMYCMEIDLPTTKLVTGLGILNGTTAGGTDKHLIAIYDSVGNLIANSATAGLATASASTYQKIALTTPYLLVGPAQYFGCMQTNGTTDTVRMAVTGTQDNYLTKGVTGQTFGTIPATITVPTTFTTAVGPYLFVY